MRCLQGLKQSYFCGMLPHPVILFDGVCNLCNRAVQFVIRRDKKKLFRFASLQSEAAAKLGKQLPIPENQDSFILIQNGKIYTGSTAALRVLRLLGGWHSLLYAFMIVPRFIRDGVYRQIARNRYEWFGRQESCWVPTPELRELFLN